jgi:hypothetical protein
MLAQQLFKKKVLGEAELQKKPEMRSGFLMMIFTR